MAGYHRIGSSRPVAPQTRRTVDQENVPPRQTQHSGRQPRARQEPFKNLATTTAPRTPLQARNLNIAAPQSRPKAAAPAKPHSVRPPAHGVAASAAIQNHREIVRRQIEALGVKEGVSATARPQQAMKLLNACIPALPDAKSIELLKQLQGILTLPNQASRNSRLAMFVYDHRLVPGAATAKPAPAPTYPIAKSAAASTRRAAKPAPAPVRQTAKPAPTRHTARPTPTQTNAPRVRTPAPAPQQQPTRRVFKSFEELATARPFPSAARPAPQPKARPRPQAQPQPSRLNLSFKDFEELGRRAPARSRPAATAAPVRTASAPPQYGRSGSTKPVPAPQFELKHFVQLERNTAQQDSFLRYSEPELLDRAQVAYDRYLAAIQGGPERDGGGGPQSKPIRTQSAPPRMQTAPAPQALDYMQRRRLGSETDARNDYHNETGGHHLAHEAHLDRQRPMTYTPAARPRREPAPRVKTEAEAKADKEFEDAQARYFNEY